MLTFDERSIGRMSCNPAIGGVGKGQLVKEIDALGGEMAKAADACAIQFRMLNSSKGPAAQSSRAQIDMDKYNLYMRKAVCAQEGLSVKEAEAKELLVKDNKVYGVRTSKGEELFAQAVILSPGTFLEGLIHLGLKSKSSGRIDEPSSKDLAQNLNALGFRLLRFKTGTCPRLDKQTIDYSGLILQEGDASPRPFSFSTKKLKLRQAPCYITYTTKETHRVILDNLKYSPLYTGIIKATGVRYCPSIEDKVVKFRDRERHQVFLEPQGLKDKAVYPNGISTSLPEEVQLKILHSIPGLEKAKVVRFGYGIEHSVIEPTQLYATLETKLIKNLYSAGQINGTTGYEEAAAQGLIAGINAASSVKGKEPLMLERSNSYIGVLIDDLITKGTLEPYRMFTSRVEYRLLLHEDNADIRLSELGYKLGLLKAKAHLATRKKSESLKNGLLFLRKTAVKPCLSVNKTLTLLKSAPLKKPATLEELLRRPQLSITDLNKFAGISRAIPEFIYQQLENEVKYAGFIQRQVSEVERFRHLEKIRLPESLDYSRIPSLSREIKEKLTRMRPFNLGQASRISGVTPAAVSMLMVYLRRFNAEGKKLP